MANADQHSGGKEARKKGRKEARKKGRKEERKKVRKEARKKGRKEERKKGRKEERKKGKEMRDLSRLRDRGLAINRTRPHKEESEHGSTHLKKGTILLASFSAVRKPWE